MSKVKFNSKNKGAYKGAKTVAFKKNSVINGILKDVVLEQPG